METDAHRLAQRQKQIDIGKNTEEYERYEEWRKDPTRTVPKIPVPNIYKKRSKRSWDGIVREWRRRLHAWYEESYVFIPTQYRCAQCKGIANFREDTGSLLFFCGKKCQKSFYSVLI